MEGPISQHFTQDFSCALDDTWGVLLIWFLKIVCRIVMFDRFSRLGIIWFTRPKFVWWIKAKLSLDTSRLALCIVDTLVFLTQRCMVPFCFAFVVLFVKSRRQVENNFLD